MMTTMKQNPAFLAGWFFFAFLSGFIVSRYLFSHPKRLKSLSSKQEDQDSTQEKREKDQTEDNEEDEDDEDDEDDENEVDDSEELKLVLVVRIDLKMGPGKVAAQCSHATLDVARKAQNINKNLFRSWEYQGSPKVVLKCPDLPTMERLEREAEKLGLTTSLIVDAGRTQVAPGSETVLAIGPGPISKVNLVTGKLKLY